MAMRPHLIQRLGQAAGLLGAIVAVPCLTACDRFQPIALTTEDYRFTPDLIRATTESPLVLTLFNAGREVHEFDSPLLQYIAERPAQAKSDRVGLTIMPGDRVRLVATPLAGTYLYICRRKGHANMTGTLIVE